MDTEQENNVNSKKFSKENADRVVEIYIWYRWYLMQMNICGCIIFYIV